MVSYNDNASRMLLQVKVAHKWRLLLWLPEIVYWGDVGNLYNKGARAMPDSRVNAK